LIRNQSGFRKASSIRRKKTRNNIRALKLPRVEAQLGGVGDSTREVTPGISGGQIVLAQAEEDEDPTRIAGRA